MTDEMGVFPADDIPSEREFYEKNKEKSCFDNDRTKKWIKKMTKHCFCFEGDYLHRTRRKKGIGEQKCILVL